MASDFIAVDIVGVEALRAKLSKLPQEAQDAIIDDVSKFYLNVLRAYPPKNYVTRADAYGSSFFTEKQRRWFFAALGSGEISVPYKRTQTLSRSWKQIGSGAKSIIANEQPYADYVMGEGQSRHEQKVGWKKLSAIVQEHWLKAMQIADAGVKKAIKKLNL